MEFLFCMDTYKHNAVIKMGAYVHGCLFSMGDYYADFTVLLQK